MAPLNEQQGFPVIHESEARGDSRAVSHEEFQGIAQKGAEYLHGTERTQSTKGLDADWEGIKNKAYKAAQGSWGGVTINSHTGHDVAEGLDAAAEAGRLHPGEGQGLDRYAVTARKPGQEQIRLHENANPEQFGAAMDRARTHYDQLGNRGHHLGVFHDDAEHAIDIDPVVVVRDRKTAEQVGAATRNVGGAYHFASGDGFFPPHVKDGQ